LRQLLRRRRLALGWIIQGYGLVARGESMGRLPPGREGGADGSGHADCDGTDWGAASALQDGTSAAVKDANAQPRWLVRRELPWPRSLPAPQIIPTLREHLAAFVKEESGALVFPGPDGRSRVREPRPAI